MLGAGLSSRGCVAKPSVAGLGRTLGAEIPDRHWSGGDIALVVVAEPAF